MEFKLRQALRVLVRHKAFSASVIISLAVGLSTGIGVLAMLDSVRRGHLPFRNADRLEKLYFVSSSLSDRSWSVSREAVRAVRTAEPVQDVAEYATRFWLMHGPSGAFNVFGAMTTANYPNVIGCDVRGAQSYSAAKAAGEPVALIARSLWIARFGGSESILGQTIDLDNMPHTVVGILPDECAFPDGSQVWTADLTTDPSGMAGATRMEAVALLRPGSTHAQGEAVITTLATMTLTQRRGPHTHDRVSAMPFRGYLELRLRPPLVLLTIIGVFVGFITVVNFAGLILARGIRRRGELGIRAAMGASIARLAAHVVSESAALSAVGGLLAALLAPFVLGLIRHSFSDLFPPWLDPDLSVVTLAAGVVAAVSVGSLFAIGPALDVARPALEQFLRSSGQTASGSASLAHTRSVVVSSQIALSCATLVCLGALTARGILRANGDVGFAYEQVARGTISQDQRVKAAGDAWPGLLGTLRSTRGVTAAFVAQTQFLVDYYVSVDGQSAAAANQSRWVMWWRASDGLVSTLKPRLVEGRLPTPEEEATGASVGLVTRDFACRMGGKVVGRTIRVDPSTARAPAAVTVVGVIENLGIFPGASEAIPMVLGPMPHSGLEAKLGAEIWLRAASGSPASVFPAINRAVGAGLGGLGVADLAPFAQTLRRQLDLIHSFTTLAAGIFGLGLGLAALGVYGLVAYAAEMRAREIAIREALGAGFARLSLLLLRSAGIEVFAGIVVGAALGTLAAARLSDGLGVVLKPAAGTSVFAVAIIAVTVAVASVGPLHNIWKRDLAIALRE